MATAPQPLTNFFGYHFPEPGHLSVALTHRSAGGRSESERLAWLGDAMLQAASSELLAEWDPTAAAGDLTEQRKALVKKEALAFLFDEHQLHLNVSISSELTTRAKAEFLEALVGCVFLDGGYESVSLVAREMYTDDVVRHCMELHAQDAAAVPRDPKVQLQELVQQRYRCVPSYEHSSWGPSHCPTFTATVTVPGHPEFSAEGQDRKRQGAERSAARALLFIMRPTSEPPRRMVHDFSLLDEGTQSNVPIPIRRSPRLVAPAAEAPPPVVEPFNLPRRGLWSNLAAMRWSHLAAPAAEAPPPVVEPVNLRGRGTESNEGPIRLSRLPAPAAEAPPVVAASNLRATSSQGRALKRSRTE